MGLAGVKKRAKLSHDPNNTNWAKNETNFGHKILSRQGWRPGDYLGAENANHSDHYTAANASHIRVMLREDNLGLGAKLGGNKADTFGLALFSGVLGRLNGKSEAEVQKKQDALRDAELRAYQNTKYGFMNFVSGGLLVGDKMELPKSTKMEDIKADGTVSGFSKKRKTVGGTNVAARKSKSEADVTIKVEDTEKAQLYAIPERNNKSAKESAHSSSDSSSEDQAKIEKRRKKELRKAEKAAKAAAEQDPTEDSIKARLKEEKRAMKEERRKRKEEKRAKRAAKQGGSSTEQTTTMSAVPSESEGTATPALINNGGRHAVRHRYIMQKRMASMNANSLKEIFMLQPQTAT